MPKANSGNTVYPDAVGKKIARELQRITEQQRRAALAPASTPNEDCAPDGTKRVASLLSERTPHYDRSEERYMSALDEFLEPFVAIQSGMSLGKAAKKYGIADIQRYQRCVQGFFTQLGTWNQLRWERAYEKRQRDATERAQPEPSRVIEADLSNTWQGVQFAVPEEIKRRRKSRKRDVPWEGEVRPVSARSGQLLSPKN